MDNKQVMARIEELLKEKHLTLNALKENTSISTTVYQWKKNAKRDATRTPSLRSIEKICAFFKISLSYSRLECKRRITRQDKRNTEKQPIYVYLQVICARYERRIGRI